MLATSVEIEQADLLEVVFNVRFALAEFHSVRW
jgi:hypothetical protein